MITSVIPCFGLRKWNIWWCNSAICPYRCAKQIVHRIGSHIVHKWDWIDLLSNTVQYVRICVSKGSQMGSHIVQSYVMTPYYSTYGYAHSLFNTVNNPSSLFSNPFPYTMKSYDVFPKFHVCKHILSAYYKWFLVESTFNIFIFKLNEFNMDVHLCFNSIVLI